MESGLKFIFDIIVWVCVPLLLGAGIVTIHAIPGKMKNKRYKVAARAGFWAGVMLFVIIFIYQISVFILHGFPDGPVYRGFNGLVALFWSVGTFIIFHRWTTLISPKWSGWIMLLLTFISFYALFHYIFIRTLNAAILSLTLSTLFGMLAHLAITPNLIHEFKQILETE